MTALASLSPDARAPPRSSDRRLREANQRGQLGAASAFITREEREVLEFYFSGECSADITTRLGMPLGAIKAHFGRGLFGFVHALSVQAPAEIRPLRPRQGCPVCPETHPKAVARRITGTDELNPRS